MNLIKGLPWFAEIKIAGWEISIEKQKIVWGPGLLSPMVSAVNNRMDWPRALFQFEKYGFQFLWTHGVLHR